MFNSYSLLEVTLVMIHTVSKKKLLEMSINLINTLHLSIFMRQKELLSLPSSLKTLL